MQLMQKFGPVNPNWSLFDFVEQMIDRNYYRGVLEDLIQRFKIFKEQLVEPYQPPRREEEEMKENRRLME